MVFSVLVTESCALSVRALYRPTGSVGLLFDPQPTVWIGKVNRSLCILRDAGWKVQWKRLSAWLDFGIFNRPKSIQAANTFFQELWSRKNLCNSLVWTCSGGKVQVWVQVQAPAGHLAIPPKGYSRRELKILTAKSMAELLEQRSSPAWAGRMGEH